MNLPQKASSKPTVSFINPALEIDMEELGKPTLVGNKLQFDVKELIGKKLKDAPAPPTIEFTRKAIDKVRALVREHSKEIAWHGTVRRDEHLNKLTVIDILMYPQTTSSATVDADETKYPMWMNTLSDEEFGTLRMQGHSHVNMQTFPSGTDEMYYRDLIDNFRDFYLIMIINKRDDILLRYYDIEQNLVYNELKTEWNQAQTGWASDEIEKHVVKGSSPTVQKNQKTTKLKHEDVKDDGSLDFDEFEFIDGPYDYDEDYADWRNYYGLE